MGKEKKVTNVKEILRERKKERQRLFTKNECNNIISKNYNPLKVNNKKYLRKKGLLMNKKNILLEEIEKKLTLKEKEILKNHTDVFIKIYKMGIEKGFNVKM